MFSILFNLWTLSSAVVVGLGVLYRKCTTGVCTSKRRMDGKTVIITGANVGIGKETARDLAARGARVIMACRDMNKAEKVRDEIVASTGNRHVVTRKLDLSSFASVRQFVKEILDTEKRLDVLVNNAGVGGAGRNFTEDNILVGMQTNHFGPFLLTVLLIDLLKKSAPSRIVTLSSVAHRSFTFNIDDMNGERSHSDMKMYCVSKLANILMSNELARRLQGTGVTSNSLHPGAVDTEIFRHMPIYLKIVSWPIMKFFFKNVVEGAQTSIYLAVSEEVEGVTGKYFVDCKEEKPSAKATNEALAKKIWNKTEMVLKLKPEEVKL